MLLSDRCEVFGLEESGGHGFVVRDTEDVLISVMGRPGRDAIEEAVARDIETWQKLLKHPELRPSVN